MFAHQRFSYAIYKAKGHSFYYLYRISGPKLILFLTNCCWWLLQTARSDWKKIYKGTWDLPCKLLTCLTWRIFVCFFQSKVTETCLIFVGLLQWIREKLNLNLYYTRPKQIELCFELYTARNSFSAAKMMESKFLELKNANN